MRTCIKCKERQVYGVRYSYCAQCQAVVAKKWRDENTIYLAAYKKKRYESMTPETKWERHLKGRYGISIIDYQQMQREQGNVCAICKSESQRLRLSVDHCHSTRMVRGLLCERCNSLLGRVKDDPKILRAAADYLDAAAEIALPKEAAK